MKPWKIAAGDWIWGDRVTRFFKVPAVLSTEKSLHRISELGFDGVELSWVNPETYPPAKIKVVVKTLNALGLDVANVYIDTSAKWPFGAFTNPSAKVRKSVVSYVKKSMDISKKLGSGMVNIWPGSDTLPHKVDYWKAWDSAVQSLIPIAEHAERIGMKISLEYKLREPGEFHLLSNSDAILRMLEAVGSKSMGATIDTGHVFQAKEHPATTVEKLGRVLYHVHLDDNYGDWDDDLPVGEVHNFTGFFKALKKVQYKGYMSLDIWPLHDPDRAATQSKEYIEEILKKI